MRITLKLHLSHYCGILLDTDNTNENFWILHHLSKENSAFSMSGQRNAASKFVQDIKRLKLKNSELWLLKGNQKPSHQ
jgi:hypothetical protein